MRAARRALEIYLAVLGAEAGAVRELLAEAGAPPLTWRSAVRRGSPHTVATRLLLLGEWLAPRLPARRTRRLLGARDAFVGELHASIGEGVLLRRGPGAGAGLRRLGATGGAS